jgi:hypothetical protein
MERDQTNAETRNAGKPDDKRDEDKERLLDKLAKREKKKKIKK